MECSKSHILRKATVFLLVLFSISNVAADTAPQMSGQNIRLQDPIYDSEDAFCSASFEDPDDGSGRLKFVWVVQGLNVENQTFVGVPDGDTVEASLQSSNYNEGDLLKCEVHATDDYGTADEQTNTSFEEYRIQSDPPNVTEGPNFFNYSSEHAFNVSAEVRDKEGSEDITDCRLTAFDDEGNFHTFEMDIDRNFGGENYARCFYSSVNNYSAGFQVLEPITVRVRAIDSGGDSNYTQEVNSIPNSFPSVYNIQPEDDSRTAADEVELEVNVMDNDGEKVDVTFYNTTSGVEQLYSESGVTGGTVSYLWQDLQSLKTYYWVVNASDGYSTTRVRLNFRNLVSSQYRVQTSIQHRYSAILTAVDNAKIVNFRVENTADVEKNLRSEISGSANARFVQYGNSHDYSLQPEEVKNFKIEVSPSGDGRDYLNITTTNDDYMITVKDSIEVYPREAVGTAPSVPGIGFIQVLLVLIFSTLYYSVRP